MELNCQWPEEVIVYTDGASRGNPGPASIGIYVLDAQGGEIQRYGERLGEQTNNFAEYTAVERSLQFAVKAGVKKVVFRSDSQLLVRQMIGQYKVKSPAIKPLYEECQKLVKQIPTVEFEHVRREMNKEADQLANDALDGLL